jgi:hypothetical protein
MSRCGRPLMTAGMGLAHPAIWLICVPVLCALARRRHRFTRVLAGVLMLMAAVDFVAAYNMGKGVWFAFTEARFSQVVHDVCAEHVESVALGAGAFDRQGIYSDTNDQLMHKAPVLGSYTAFRSLFMPFEDAPVARKQAAMKAFAFATGPQRIWFSDAPVVCPPAPALLAAFWQRSLRADSPSPPSPSPLRSPLSPPLLIHSRDEMLRMAQDQESGPGMAAIVADAAPMRRLASEVLKYTPQSMRIRITAPSSGWLLVTDRWARSWRASVDGVRTPVLGGNFLYRAVRVGPGDHVVRMWYDLKWLYCCIALSWGSMIGVVLLSAWHVRRTMREASGAKREPAPPRRELTALP